MSEIQLNPVLAASKTIAKDQENCNPSAVTDVPPPTTTLKKWVWYLCCKSKDAALEMIWLSDDKDIPVAMASAFSKPVEKEPVKDYDGDTDGPKLHRSKTASSAFRSESFDGDNSIGKF